MEYQPPPPPQPQPSPGPPQKTSMGLEPNVAAGLSYLCTWVTGLIFFLVEKDNKFVRFHAMQSLIAFGGLTVLFFAVQIIGEIPVIGVIWWVATPLLSLAWLVLWVICMIKAFQGDRFKLPVAGEMAEKYI